MHIQIYSFIFSLFLTPTIYWIMYFVKKKKRKEKLPPPAPPPQLLLLLFFLKLKFLHRMLSQYVNCKCITYIMLYCVTRLMHNTGGGGGIKCAQNPTYLKSWFNIWHVFISLLHWSYEVNVYIYIFLFAGDASSKSNVKVIKIVKNFFLHLYRWRLTIV